jgi:hypothetical protein
VSKGGGRVPLEDFTFSDLTLRTKGELEPSLSVLSSDFLSAGAAVGRRVVAVVEEELDFVFKRKSLS